MRRPTRMALAFTALVLLVPTTGAMLSSKTRALEEKVDAIANKAEAASWATEFDTRSDETQKARDEAEAMKALWGGNQPAKVAAWQDLMDLGDNAADYALLDWQDAVANHAAGHVAWSQGIAAEGPPPAWGAALDAYTTCNVKYLTAAHYYREGIDRLAVARSKYQQASALFP